MEELGVLTAMWRIPTRTSVAVIALLLGGRAPIAAQAPEFPESVFAREPAPTTRIIRGRPFALSPAYDELVGQAMVSVAGTLYILAQSARDGGGAFTHLIAVRGRRDGAARAVATTSLLGAGIDSAAELRVAGDTLIVAGPTRSLRLASGRWSVSGPGASGPAPPAAIGPDLRRHAWRDDAAGREGTWWVVGRSLAATDSAGPAGGDLSTDGTGINEIGARARFHRPPGPPRALYVRQCKDAIDAGGTEGDTAVVTDFHAWQRVGRRVWFGNAFYSGEGRCGIGGIGAFDLDTRTFDMRWGAGSATESISAIYVAGDDVWVGLRVHPEGAPVARGAAHYSLRTLASRRVDVPGMIHAIGSVSGTIVFSSSAGLFILRGGTVAPVPIDWEK